MPKVQSASGENGASAASEEAVPQAGVSFEDAMRDLERIILDMEGGHLSLEQSLAAYKRGAGLLRHCQGALERVREQVRILEGEELKAFDADAARPPGRATGAGN